MPLQQPVWCTQWPMRAPWANWRLAAAMRSGVGTRKPSESNSTVCNWRPFTAGRVWYMASWSTSLLTSRDHRTPGSGVAAALMWSLEKSSPGTSLMPVKPTGTSTPGWGCITIEWGGRWVGRNTNISPFFVRNLIMPEVNVLAFAWTDWNQRNFSPYKECKYQSWAFYIVRYRVKELVHTPSATTIMILIAHHLDALWFSGVCKSKIKFHGQADKKTGCRVLKTIRSN